MTGLKIAAGVATVVMAFVAIIALINGIIGGVGGWFGFAHASLKERLLKETCEDSVAGLNRRANKIPPGIAINDAASKYSTGTPRAA